MAQLLDGRELSKSIREDVRRKIEALPESTAKPSIGIILCTQDESAVSYINVIKKAAENVGIEVSVTDLSGDCTQQVLIDTVKKLAHDTNTHGIIIQTPVLDEVDIDAARSLIPLEKDIDGANPLSAGRLFSSLESFAPATAAAVIEIIHKYGIETAGKHAVVIGRSRIVGKPVAHMLLDLNATVTVCHSKSGSLTQYTKSADIVVAAAGKIGLVSKEHVTEKTVVIDVGTNFDDQGRLVGDINFESVEKTAKAITPVPGGVGPVTTAILLRNTYEAFSRQNPLR